MIKILKFRSVAVVAALLVSSASFAQDFSYEITPVIGYNMAEGNINVDDYLIYGAEFQYNDFGALKPELSIIYGSADYNAPTHLNNKDTDVWRFGLNGVYEFGAINNFTPFVKAGIGYENFSDNYDSGNHNSVYVDAGAGAKYPLASNIDLKVEAIYMNKNNDNRLDSNLELLAGITFKFGAKTQEVAKVVVVDSDNDGIADDKDSCPNSAPGVKVDANGCELDSDKDGIVDSLDKCPHSAIGAKVDANGCELDSDNDGVVDSLDRCPNTSAGAKVDANGCELDGDKDGVGDSLDKCPNTPAGAKVDNQGCQEKVNLQINFATGSYNVDAQSMKNIKKFSAFLKAVPNYNVEIVGYTDDVGSARNNKILSKKRADKVRKLIIQEGVSPSRVTSVGMGEDEPIASNATPEGRAKNRRIEAHLKEVK